MPSENLCYKPQIRMVDLALGSNKRGGKEELKKHHDKR